MHERAHTHTKNQDTIITNCNYAYYYNSEK